MPVRPKGIVEKCNLCAEYRALGQDPVCVQACPGKARVVGDLDDPSSEISRLVREREGFTLLPEKATRPKVFYLPPARKEASI